MTDTPSIPPALAPDQWESRVIKFGEWYEDAQVSAEHGGIEAERWTTGDEGGTVAERIDLTPIRHAVAALALYGQPFGFTQEDVEAIDTALGMAMEYASERSGLLPDWPKERALIERVMAKLEALLPPK